MQTLDTLGSGFSLASHDLDIRGAGNLLGDQQTGHVREVGIELYQQMLKEAVSESRNLNENITPETDWSPQISIGVSVLIPETFVPEINLRMSLYRRLASLSNEREIESFAAELCDRFGQIPQEVENLLRTISLKNLCKAAGIEKLEGGTRGVVITFRNASFANPVGLVNLIAKKNGSMKLRNDHKLVFTDDWTSIKTRFDGVESLVSEIIQILHEP